MLVVNWMELIIACIFVSDDELRESQADQHHQHQKHLEEQVARLTLQTTRQIIRTQWQFAQPTPIRPQSHTIQKATTSVLQRFFSGICPEIIARLGQR